MRIFGGRGFLFTILLNKTIQNDEGEQEQTEDKIEILKELNEKLKNTDA